MTVESDIDAGARRLTAEWRDALRGFMDYVHLEQGLAENTVSAYARDLDRYATVLEARGVTTPVHVSQADVSALLQLLGELGLEASSVARNLTAVRMFHRYLLAEGMIENDPTEHMKSPKLGRKLPAVLNIYEVERLMMEPDVETTSGSPGPRAARDVVRSGSPGFGADRPGTDAPPVRPGGGARDRQRQPGADRTHRNGRRGVGRSLSDGCA